MAHAEHDHAGDGAGDRWAGRRSVDHCEGRQLAWRIAADKRFVTETLAPTEQLIGVDLEFAGDQRDGGAIGLRTCDSGTLECIAVTAIRPAFRPGCNWLNDCVHK